MSRPIEESILVAAPPENLWRLLENPYQWRVWWPGLRSAESGDRRPLHDGSKLELSIDLGLLTATLRADVEVVAPPRTLIWSGRLLTARVRHSIFLEARANGTTVRRRESWEGLGALPMRLLGLERAAARSYRGSLKGLKRLVERGG